MPTRYLRVRDGRNGREHDVPEAKARRFPDRYTVIDDTPVSRPRAVTLPRRRAARVKTPAPEVPAVDDTTTDTTD